MLSTFAEKQMRQLPLTNQSNFIKFLEKNQMPYFHMTGTLIINGLETVACRCSSKWVFLKISQIS